jgi:hypothetical protein
MDTPVEHRQKEAPIGFLFNCPNLQDRLVVERLSKEPLSSLSVDESAGLLRNDGKPQNAENVRALRVALILVYVRAGTVRKEARATKGQIANAQKALNSATKTLKLLERVRVGKQRGLQSAFGSAVDDIAGLEETNDFEGACQQIRLEMAPHILNLQRAIEIQKLKRSQVGERKKRLRILTESLAKWWVSEIGTSIAPYVRAKRLDGGKALLLGREGQFLSLAIALFCQTDRFKESEVISAVTSVHKDFLAKKNSQQTSAIRLVKNRPI